MKIEVLGPGCPRCQTLYQEVMNACAELNLPADIQKIEDIQKMTEMGIWATPALAIDGKVVLAGRVPKREELKAILSAKR